MNGKINHFVTIGRFRIYYQFEVTISMQTTYWYYAGRSFTGKIDLINGLDKLAVL